MIESELNPKRKLFSPYFKETTDNMSGILKRHDSIRTVFLKRTRASLDLRMILSIQQPAGSTRFPAVAARLTQRLVSPCLKEHLRTIKNFQETQVF